MAQESFDQLHNAVKQAESRGQRYDKSGELLTSPKGAQGEMQVMPATQLDPGYGVAPAKDRTPAEIARVGKDYLSAMLNKYGNEQHALVAYNWGPKNADTWLASGANPAKLPAETQNYLQKVQEYKGQPLSAAGAAPSVPKKVAGVDLNEVGPGYKAAMAMMFLGNDKADSDETDKEDIWKEAEPETTAEEAAPSPLAGLELGYQSPFPVKKPAAPQRLAAGGLAGAPKVGVKGTARDALDAVKAEYDQYAKDAEAYNTDLNKYKTDIYDPYAADVTKYNTGLETYKTNVYNPYAEQVTAYNNSLDKYKQDLYNPYLTKVQDYNDALAKYKTETYDPYITAVDNYNAALNKYNTDVYTPYSTALDAYNTAAEAWNAGPRTTAFDKTAPTLASTFTMAAPTAPAAFSGTVPTAPEAFSGTAPAAPEAFSMTVPTLSKTFDKTAPTTPKTTQAEYDAMAAAAKQDVVNRQQAIDVASNPEAYGLTINKLFSHGGVVHRADGSPETGELTPEEIEAASRPAFMTPKSGIGRVAGPISKALNSGEAYPAMARGVAELPYDVVGGPVDIATMAMRPFGYKEEKPVMGSDWIKEKMTKLGIRPGEEANPTLQGFRTAGELGASAVNPTKAVAKTGQAVEKGAAVLGKEVARQALRGLEGEGMLAPVSPPILYAVKPKGGTFATSGSLTEEPISRLDDLLANYSEALKNKIPESHHAAVDTFVDKKMRKYLTQDFGTGNDPLRTAMRSGDMPLYGADVENFPEYMLAAARDPNAPGHAQAKRHLEKAYDEATRMKLEGLALHNPSDADERRRYDSVVNAFKEKQRAQMTTEGLPAEYQNPPNVQSFSIPDLERYPSIGKTMSNVLGSGERGTLPSGQVWALQNQQPLYDLDTPGMEFLKPKNVAETLGSLNPDKLKNMSFEQAMLEGTKGMRVFREYDTAVDRAAKGLSVPKEVVAMFTKPVTKTDAGEWVKLTEPAATKLEGKLMHHSVGGYADNPHYNLGGPEAFKSGKAQIFSLRGDKTGMPEVTIEAERTPDGIKINQIKGDYNSFPSHRAEDVFKFLDKHPEIKDINSEYYPKSNTGEDLQQKIGVDWKGSYEHWKQGLPGEWRVTRDTDNRIDYVYALPEGKAAGGMIERNKGDNRRYL